MKKIAFISFIVAIVLTNYILVNNGDNSKDTFGIQSFSKMALAEDEDDESGCKTTYEGEEDGDSWWACYYCSDGSGDQCGNGCCGGDDGDTWGYCGTANC